MSVNFNVAKLSKAVFQDVKMPYAMFWKSNLHGTIFLNANFCDANFEKAEGLENAFIFAKYDDNTKFPEGFNPENHENLKYISPDDKNK